MSIKRLNKNLLQLFITKTKVKPTRSNKKLKPLIRPRKKGKKSGKCKSKIKKQLI